MDRKKCVLVCSHVSVYDAVEELLPFAAFLEKNGFETRASIDYWARDAYIRRGADYAKSDRRKPHEPGFFGEGGFVVQGNGFFAVSSPRKLQRLKGESRPEEFSPKKVAQALESYESFFGVRVYGMPLPLVAETGHLDFYLGIAPGNIFVVDKGYYAVAGKQIEKMAQEENAGALIRTRNTKRAIPSNFAVLEKDGVETVVTHADANMAGELARHGASVLEYPGSFAKHAQLLGGIRCATNTLHDWTLLEDLKLRAKTLETI